MTTTEAETKVESQAKDETLNEANSKENDGKQTAEQNSTPASPVKKTETLKPVVTVHKKDFEKDVVYVYQFVRTPVIPSLSACCVKIETWLRLNGLQYENIDHKLRYKSKKGQLPFVEINGKELEDSDFIIKELSKHFDKDIDSGLTEEQKTLSYAFISMLNNHTGWIVRWWRYNNAQELLETTQLDIKRTLNSKIPNSVLNFIFKLGFKKQLRDSVGSGSGRFSKEEVIESAKEDLKALSNLLGTKDYFFGKEPSLLDIIAFSHLAQFIYVPFGGIKEWLESDAANLLALVERIKAKCWPDWEEMSTSLELNTHLPKKEVPAVENATADAETPKSDDESKKNDVKKKKEKEEKKKDKKEKKKKESKKEKNEEKTEESKDIKEPAKEDANAPNGGEAPKTEVAASE